MKKTENLDQFKSAYSNDSEFSQENELLLNYYAQRVIVKTNGGALLELGLGHGHTALMFSKNFKNYTVIDGSTGIIQMFKDKNPHMDIKIKHSYFEEFETDVHYDVIVAGFILEHVDDPMSILKRYKTFLKSSGKMFVAVPNATALNKRLGYEAGIIDDMFALSDADLQFGHKRIFCKDSLVELVTACGYHVKSLEGLFLKPITTSQMHTLQLSEDVLEAMLTIGLEYPELSVGLLAELELAI